jgi:hypothetical protein
MRKLKHEGYKVADYIRAWDFEPIGDRKPRYAEGFITEVRREGSEDMPFAHYVVSVNHDTVFMNEPREIIFVPMECLMLDWDNRVELLSKGDG